jgi:circadian clock protein KaiC
MSNLATTGTLNQTKNFLMRLIDMFKSQQITVFFTNLLQSGAPLEHTELGVSSLMDTWLELRTIETNGERNRTLYVLKSRGMQHSNQVREFVLTSNGIELIDVYLGQNNFLTGTARVAQQSQEKLAQLNRKQEFDRKKLRFEQQQSLVQAQIKALEIQLAIEKAELELFSQQEETAQQVLTDSKVEMSFLRKADQANL